MMPARRWSFALLLAVAALAPRSSSAQALIGYFGRIEIRSPDFDLHRLTAGEAFGAYVVYRGLPGPDFDGLRASLDLSELGAPSESPCADPGPDGEAYGFDCVVHLPLGARPGPATIWLVTRNGAGAESRLPRPVKVLPPADVDEDGLPDRWEAFFGLGTESRSGADGADGANGDPDGDGVRNTDEYTLRTHPRGRFTRYVAEIPPFGTTAIDSVNASGEVARVMTRYVGADGPVTAHLGCALADADLLAASCPSEDPPPRFDWGRPEGVVRGAVIESDVDIGVRRSTRWDEGGTWRSHASEAVTGASTSWLFAEGVASGGLASFLLLLNPGTTDADVTIAFLLPQGARPCPPGTHACAPPTHAVRVAPQSVRTIWLDLDVPALEGRAFAMVVASTTPIVAERSTYLLRAAGGLGGGTSSAGVTAPRVEWHFAEGATGPLFDTYVLVANPSAMEAHVSIAFHPAGAEAVDHRLVVPAGARETVRVADVSPALRAATFGISVLSLDGVPIVAERAMWFPGRAPGAWRDGHVSHGLAPALRWRADPGAASDWFVLLFNPGPRPARVRIRPVPPATSIHPDDVETTVALERGGRATLDRRLLFHPSTWHWPWSIESLDGVPIVVEQSSYWPAGPFDPGWSGGHCLPGLALPD